MMERVDFWQTSAILGHACLSESQTYSSEQLNADKEGPHGV
jgi:hypothetical protein